MGFLDWKRSDGVAGYPIMLTRKSHLFASEKALYDDNRLGQPIDPDGTSIKAQANLFIFRSDAASAQTEFKSSVCQEIDRRSFTSDKYGMAKVIVQHVRPHPELFRNFGGDRQCRDRGDAISEVVGQSKCGIPQRLDFAGFLNEISPRLYMPDAHTKSERLHLATTGGGTESIDKAQR